MGIRRRTARAASFALAALVLAAPASAAISPASPDHAAGTPRILLKLRPQARVPLRARLRSRTPATVPGSRLRELLLEHGAKHTRRLVPIAAAARSRLRARFAHRALRARASRALGLSRIWRIDVAGVSMQQALRDLRADAAVEWAEADLEVRAALLPNDFYLSRSGSWGQPFADLWGLYRIQAPAAWDRADGSGVVVAVIDTGIEAAHPDIAANIWKNTGEIAGNGVDEDGNGYVDDVAGYDFADNDAEPVDDHMHGTHVAGTIAAVAGNGIGIAGVAFGAEVMAVRGLDSNGSGRVSALAESIAYAVDNGADVINASWTGGGFSQALADAVGYAHDAGVVFVTAAGNDGADTSDVTPANLSDAITVAAFDSRDVLASFSNRGIKLDLGAPGGGDVPPPALQQTPVYSILSLLSAFGDVGRYGNHLEISPGYARLAGTSMAAPHVAGAAALLLQLHPEWSVEQVRQALRVSARDVSPAGPDAACGFGLLDAAAALDVVDPLVAHITSPRAGSSPGATAIEITGVAEGTGLESYVLEYGSDGDGEWTTIAHGTTAVSGGTLGTWNLATVLDGTYVLRLTARRGEEEFVDRVPVTIGSAELTSPEPAQAVRAGGLLPITGTAAGAGFTSYSVEWRRPSVDAGEWSSEGVVRTSPNQPVRGGVLATFDTSSAANDRYDFRLKVFNANGTVERVRQGIALDPALRAGWPQQIQPVADHQYLTVADVDGDMLEEILVGSGNEVVVFRHDGTLQPGWPRSVAGSHPDSTTTGSPVVADVDGDTAADVVATNRYELFAWSAAGELLPGFPVTTSVLRGADAHLSAGDLDGDGDDEILCSSSAGSQAFDGDGSVVAGWQPSSLSDAPLAVADVAGDARAEAAFYSRDGSGVAARRALSLRDAARAALPGWPVRARMGQPYPRLVLGDLDGDFSHDLFALAEFPTGKVSARAWSVAGERIATSAVRIRDVCRAEGARCDPTTSGTAVLADTDDDSRAEAWLYVHTPAQQPVAQGFGQFVAAYADRDRRPVPASHRYFNTSMDLQSVAVGDIDGDGEQELVTGSSGYDRSGIVRHAVVAAAPDGTLHPMFPRVVPIPIYAGGDPPELPRTDFEHFDDARFASPAIADLDGDGRAEVVWVDPVLLRVFVWNVPGTPSQLRADWPMYGHDPRRSSAW